MSGRPTREVALAVAYAKRTGCTPAQAAAKYKVGVRSVQRGVAEAGKAAPVGRPRAP